ncbi:MULTISPECIES: glutamate--cysteine ligase [Streptomyces]|uniref:glutamate--cysteine ligase n=1 Tax=Streptomyces TaxID=1883 RepID=UPI001602EF44|nr:glutamate--cysteine ligase [Streptomyces murinus]MBA9044002.1 carboxylate-amine ligase [Streptomyces murinus]
MRTVGVEEELLLVDPDSGDPKALAAPVLARADRDDPGQQVFEKELFGQMLEFATHPQSDMADLGDEIVRCRKEAARHAGQIGCAVAALATSPLPVSPSLTVNERYQWLSERYGIGTRDQLVCGCHVHVSVESDEEGVAVLDRLRPWLPVLTAISANSPFWQGHDSGYESYRSRVWSRWPSAGPTELFGSPELYHRRVADMVGTGVILDEAMVYFDARLSARYPDHSVSLLRLASWQAARSGLEEKLLDPVSLRPRPAARVLYSLLDTVGDALDACGDTDRAEKGVEDLLRHGNGAREQRRIMEGGGTLRDVVTECVRHTQG